MKVESINRNFASPKVQKRNAKPNFTGGIGSVAEQITNALPGKNAITKMKNLEWLKGEIGGILITALGTGLVAPIFIGFNPFVKAPKGSSKEQKKDVANTKIYTAMRQPISAVLAILFQVSALKPIDKFLDQILNNPKYSKNLSLHIDQSALNNDSYLKTITRKELEAEGHKKPSIFGILKDGYAKTKEKRAEYDKLLKDRVKAKADAQLSQLAENFTQTGRIKIGERYLDDKTLAELINNQINDYIGDAQKLKIDNNGLAFYTKRAKTLIGNEDHLREIFKDIPYEEILKENDPNKLQNLYKQTETTLKALLQKEESPEVKEIIQEILNRPEDIRASRVSRTLKRIESIKQACPEHVFSPDKYLDAMSLRNAELDRTITKLKLSKITDPASANGKTITDTIAKVVDNCRFESTDELLKSILHDTDTFDSNVGKLTSKVHKDITKLYKKLVENKYKAPNQIIKILIGVCITLPITCNALNWVYPRFMELVFPKISGVKKGEAQKAGGDK